MKLSEFERTLEKISTSKNVSADVMTAYQGTVEIRRMLATIQCVQSLNNILQSEMSNDFYKTELTRMIQDIENFVIFYGPQRLSRIGIDIHDSKFNNEKETSAALLTDSSAASAQQNAGLAAQQQQQSQMFADSRENFLQMQQILQLMITQQVAEQLKQNRQLQPVNSQASANAQSAATQAPSQSYAQPAFQPAQSQPTSLSQQSNGQAYGNYSQQPFTAPAALEAYIQQQQANQALNAPQQTNAALTALPQQPVAVQAPNQNYNGSYPVQQQPVQMQSQNYNGAYTVQQQPAAVQMPSEMYVQPIQQNSSPAQQPQMQEQSYMQAVQQMDQSNYHSYVNQPIPFQSQIPPHIMPSNSPQFIQLGVTKQPVYPQPEPAQQYVQAAQPAQAQQIVYNQPQPVVSPQIQYQAEVQPRPAEQPQAIQAVSMPKPAMPVHNASPQPEARIIYDDLNESEKKTTAHYAPVTQASTASDYRPREQESSIFDGLNLNLGRNGRTGESGASASGRDFLLSLLADKSS